MDKFDRKLARSIQQDPPFDCLTSLRSDVWKTIQKPDKKREGQHWVGFTFSPAIMAFSLILVLGSCLALSQIRFEKGVEPDLFDLRYFSYQSLATTNLLSLNSQGTLR